MLFGILFVVSSWCAWVVRVCRANKLDSLPVCFREEEESMMAPIDDISPDLSPFETLFIQQLDLEQDLGDGNDTDRQQKLVWNYLQNAAANDLIIVDDYFKDLQWLNVKNENISLSRDLNHKIVVCDFFTYCCINCLHVLPVLHEFERDYCYQRTVQLLGISSPKFENEKSIQNVADAIMRYDITHPVGNDAEMRLWSHLGVNCWPTIVIIGPDARLLFRLVGEKAIKTRLRFYVDACLRYFTDHNQLDAERSGPQLSLLRDSLLRSTDDLLLKYPSKIAFSPSGEKIAIANSLDHTIIVTDRNESMCRIIGTAEQRGQRNGSLGRCEFNRPQGIAWQTDDILYVCDTDNDSIRRIDLQMDQIETITPNIDDQATSLSPWDATFDPTRKRLYIAMAGTHQIWILILSPEGETIHGEHRPFRSFVPFAGDGNEQKRNNRFALKASFAQPSGVVASRNSIYVADSESSSIRLMDVDDNGGAAVSTVVGGAANPLDLFSYGDIDGDSRRCRLQHPMSVAVHPADPRYIFIADTYNHKIKRISLDTKQCETIKLDWSDFDNSQPRSLNEPDGIALFADDDGNLRLLLCDTNNHRILTINLTENNRVSKFNITKSVSELLDDQPVESGEISSQDYVDSCQCVRYAQNDIVEIDAMKQNLQLELKFDFIADLKASPPDAGGKHRFKIYTKDRTPDITFLPETQTTGNLCDVTFLITPRFDLNDRISDQISSSSTCATDSTIVIQCDLAVCNQRLDACQALRIAIEQPVRFLRYHRDIRSESDVKPNLCRKTITVSI